MGGRVEQVGGVGGAPTGLQESGLNHSTNPARRGSFMGLSQNRQTKRKRAGARPARLDVQDSALADVRFVLSRSQLPSGHLAAALIAFEFVVELLTFVDRAQGRTFNSRNVDEHVAAAIFRLDETEALGRVEPLHGACCHVAFSTFKYCAGEIGPTGWLRQAAESPAREMVQPGTTAAVNTARLRNEWSC